jgi:hypothetical protein
VRQIIYVSEATEQFAAADLLGLLEVARRSNTRIGVTGLLVHRGGTFLQCFEGPPHAVETLLSRIRNDPRHAAVTVLQDRITTERLFPDWCMGFEEVAQVIPATFPGLSQVLPPQFSVSEWSERRDLALAFFEACRSLPSTVATTGEHR